MSTPPPLRALRPTLWPYHLLKASGLVIVLLLATLSGLRLCGWLRPFRVPTVAMAPTLCPDDLIMAEGLSLFGREPRRGEMVVFGSSTIPMLSKPGNAIIDMIKRIVALPGDRCQIKDSKIWINGAPAPELSGHQYSLVTIALSDSAGIDLSKEVVVPPSQYIVLGDNTQNSLDSRYWGFLPRSSIKLVYFCHYWRSADRSTSPRPH